MSTPSAEFGNRPLDQWKVTELKDELRRRRITTKGLKEDLIRRLEEAIRSDGVNVNPGNGQQTDTYGSDNKDGDSVQNYNSGQNANINDESVTYQRNLNFNIKDEDESVADEDPSNIDVDDDTETAKGSQNDYNQDNKVVQEIASSPKPSESNIASGERGLPDVDEHEPKSKVQRIDDASDPRIKDAEPEESDSLHQVSEKVSPVVGFQLKCESLSTDSMSINEENELKDSLNADNVHLESEVVKLRMMQESSGYVPHQGGDSRPLEEQVQAGRYQITLEEGGDADDDDQAIDVDCSLKDDRIGQDEVRSPYRVDVAGNITEESLNEDRRNLKHLPGTEEMESKNEEHEIPQVNSARDKGVVGMEFCQERKEKGAEDKGNDAGTLGEKRKKEDLDAGLHEPAKRQRRWNSGNNLAADGTKLTTEKDLPRTLEAAYSLPSTVPTSRDRPSVVKPSMSRLDSMNNGDEQKERVVLPSQRPSTNSLRIDRFLRPFTLKAVQELLAKTGTVTNFWMDHIKTHCYVTYSSVDEAINTRNALYNLQWPSNGGRQLIAEFVDREEVKLKIEGPPPPSVASGPVNAPPLSSSLPYNHIPFKPPTQATAGPPQHALPPPPPPPPLPLPPPPVLAPSNRERLPVPPKKVEPPVLTLDDLFKKTRANPRIYYLPLSEEEVAAKLAAKGKNKMC